MTIDDQIAALPKMPKDGTEFNSSAEYYVRLLGVTEARVELLREALQDQVDKCWCDGTGTIRVPHTDTFSSCSRCTGTRVMPDDSPCDECRFID